MANLLPAYLNLSTAGQNNRRNKMSEETDEDQKFTADAQKAAQFWDKVKQIREEKPYLTHPMSVDRSKEPFPSTESGIDDELRMLRIRMDFLEEYIHCKCENAKRLRDDLNGVKRAEEANLRLIKKTQRVMWFQIVALMFVLIVLDITLFFSSL